MIAARDHDPGEIPFLTRHPCNDSSELMTAEYGMSRRRR
jgi:hypothetical protein